MPAEARPSRTRRLRRLSATVRFRVTAIAALAVVVVLVATGVALVIAQRSLLTEGLDNALRQRADDIATLVVTGNLPPTLGGLQHDAAAQVVRPDGVVVAASPNINGMPPLGAVPPAGRTEIIRTVHSITVDADAFRLLSRRVDGPTGPVVVHVAGNYDNIVESGLVLATTLSVAIPVVALLLAAMVWGLVGRTLRPVEAVRAEVADIGVTDLHRRLPQPESDDEIARLVTTMNAMLARLEDATQRQQRFVADASHELRGPITRVRSELEVDLAHPDTADLARTHRSILEEAVGLQRLVDDLLLLARSDAGAAVVRADVVDLDDIVLREAHRLRADGRLTVDTTGVCAARVRGDRGQLGRAVRNLTDNAARHARGTVSLAVAEQGGTAALSVVDDGPGIPPDKHDHVFERFSRLDEARAADSGGAGLGLAIARDIIERHGGAITIDTDHGSGTRFLVTLPAVQ